MVFHDVVSATEVSEVVGRGGAAVFGGDGVVDVAAVDGEGAADEAAVLVAGGEVSAEAGGDSVAVDGENISGGVDT